MKNHVQPGHVLTFIGAAGGHLSGDLVVIGSMFGISTGNVSEDAEGELALGGVYALPKVSAQAWTQGVKLYWDATAKLVTSVSTANTYIGVAAAAAANPSASGWVRLNDSF